MATRESYRYHREASLTDEAQEVSRPATLAELQVASQEWAERCLGLGSNVVKNVFQSGELQQEDPQEQRE